MRLMYPHTFNMRFLQWHVPAAGHHTDGRAGLCRHIRMLRTFRAADLGAAAPKAPCMVRRGGAALAAAYLDTFNFQRSQLSGHTFCVVFPQY